MNQKLINSVASRWVRLGAMFNVEAAAETPDVEMLLLDTARASGANSRLFILAATWLAQHSLYVARQRLTSLIREKLEPEHRATLGFMLEWATKHGAEASHFKQAIKACRAGGRIRARKANARPLSDVEANNAVFSRLAEQRASKLSRKWGRWMADFALKEAAMRPVEWIPEHNPKLRTRALTGGDLVGSVLAEVESDSGAIKSESELARRCGASRPGVRDALEKLRHAGLICVERRRMGNAIRRSGISSSLRQSD